MKAFIIKYGGWIGLGITTAVIIYLLFFKPIPNTDNSAAIKSIDSLGKINKQLNGQLTNFAYQYGIMEVALEDQNKTLLTQNDFLKLKTTATSQANVSLAKQVQYYKANEDTTSYDSACDLLAKQVIDYDLERKDYQINTDKLIQNFSEQINDRDSMIVYQSNLIVSDSLLIKAQGKLNNTQQGQLNTLNKRVKLLTWVGRGLLVTSGVLFIMFESK